MRNSLDIPAAWRGETLRSLSDQTFELTPVEIGEINQALERTAGSRLESIDRDAFKLPNFSRTLANIQTDLENGTGVAIIRGFPIHEYDLEQAQRVFWGVCRHVGTPVSQSALGERIFSVRDAGYAPDDPRARGPNTRKRLSYHTDRCDVIAFLCLRQARSGGENFVVSSVTLYNEMLENRPDLVEVLMQPFYHKRHNVDSGNDQAFCQQPIFSIHQGYFAANFLRVLIERAYSMPDAPSMTDAQRESLDYLEQLADRPDLHLKFRQEPGDLLLLNNFVTFHRRTEFEDHAEPAQKRHILRIWLSVPNSRPLHPLFQANYGATEAGVLRGGMRPASSAKEH